MAEIHPAVGIPGMQFHEALESGLAILQASDLDEERPFVSKCVLMFGVGGKEAIEKVEWQELELAHG